MIDIRGCYCPPIAGIKGNVTLYGSGSTGYSYGKEENFAPKEWSFQYPNGSIYDPKITYDCKKVKAGNQETQICQPKK